MLIDVGVMALSVEAGVLNDVSVMTGSRARVLCRRACCSVLACWSAGVFACWRAVPAVAAVADLLACRL